MFHESSSDPLYRQVSSGNMFPSNYLNYSVEATTNLPYGLDTISLHSPNNSNMEVKVDSEMDVLPWYGTALCITAMLFIWIVGSVGNFLVVYVVCKEKQLQTPINMFLVNLSIADFLTSALGSPFPLIAAIFHRWPFGDMMCTVYGFGMAFGGITSITTLMVLAFERYLMIARPFRAADIRMYHSTAIIFLIWIYSLALTLPPLFGWASYGPEARYISCSVSWEKDDIATKTYICFLFILGLVIPVITVTFSYIGIVTTIKSTSQVQSCSRTATSRAELRVTAMVGVMITCFLVAWSPYAIVSLISSFGGPQTRKLITPTVSVLPAIFAKSSTCYNPIIYVGLNTQFQHAWMKVFGFAREDRDGQTGLTLSQCATVSVAPTLNPSQAALQPNKSVSQQKLVQQKANCREEMSLKSPAQDDPCGPTVIELVPIIHQNHDHHDRNSVPAADALHSEQSAVSIYPRTEGVQGLPKIENKPDGIPPEDRPRGDQTKTKLGDIEREG